jgi:hypothetical protein
MQIAFATAEAEAGYTWITEIAKLSLSDEIIIDDEERKVITRYKPLGKFLHLTVRRVFALLSNYHRRCWRNRALELPHSTRYVYTLTWYSAGLANQTGSPRKDSSCLIGRKYDHRETLVSGQREGT